MRRLRDQLPEIDILVEIAAASSDVSGARMTGGVFGGCTVNLVKRDTLDDFCTAIADRYQGKTAIEFLIYVSEAAAGSCGITSQTAQTA